MAVPLHCLQVEDSESDAALIVRLLKKAKFQVHGERVESAKDLRAALIRQHWDIIIADFHLPSFDAYKALSVLQETGLDIPFIGISGKMGNEIAAEMMNRGAADYMTKNNLERLVPVVIRELREAETRKNRKIAEAALAAEKERLWTTLCNIGEAVITTDIQGTITLLNPAAEKATRWSTVEATNRSLSEVFKLLNPHTRKPCPNPAKLSLETGDRQESHCPNLLIDRHGVEHMVTYSALPIKGGSNEVIGVILVFRDVTEKEKIGEILRNSNKLKSIGIVASEIAHNFSNFLSSIMGNIELAQEYCRRKNLTKAMERLSLTLNIFNSAKDMTQQLFTLAQGRKPILKAMSIGPILCQSARFVLRGSKIVYEIHLPESLWFCDLDENQMGLVLDNILLNSRKAMPEGGSISIAVENMPAGSPDIPAQISGDVVRVSIFDTGSGIGPERLPCVSDPSFIDKQCLENELELSSVYSVIKQHGGLVVVESQIGKGTTFLLYIPRSKTGLPTKTKS
ncbi:MAG: response regulator [Candidatus Riflebacteria bacterium]|nr:response regulator [Candidatus Riflebacteria bacterium]